MPIRPPRRLRMGIALAPPILPGPISFDHTPGAPPVPSSGLHGHYKISQPTQELSLLGGTRFRRSDPNCSGENVIPVKSGSGTTIGVDWGARNR